MFRLAERYSGNTRENTPSDGILKDGKNIKISLIFELEADNNRFEREVIELLFVFSGFKRPLVDVDESSRPNQLILKNQRTEEISLENKAIFHRVYKHDYTGNAVENNDDFSFGEIVNVTDPEVRVQMIEDPLSSYWYNQALEAAHIKDKSMCTKEEQENPNNFIYMSRLLHCFFDGLNINPHNFPSMKIQYVRHEEQKVACPIFGDEPGDRPLGLGPRQRVTVRIIFWDSDIRHYAMLFIRSGGNEINPTTYEIDLFFK